MKDFDELEIRIVANIEKAREKLSKVSDKPLTMEEVYEHLRNHPNWCEFGHGCDVCMAAHGYPVED